MSMSEELGHDGTVTATFSAELLLRLHEQKPLMNPGGAELEGTVLSFLYNWNLLFHSWCLEIDMDRWPLIQSRATRVNWNQEAKRMSYV